MNPLELGLLTGLVVAAMLLLLLLIMVLRLGARLAALAEARDARTQSDSMDRLMGSVGAQLQRIDQQMDSLHRVFMTPRLRGPAGEVLLQNLIESWLPPESYDFQHVFSNGARVDAVLRLGDHLVSVDAKFPLEQLSGLDAGAEGADTAQEAAAPKETAPRAMAQAARVLEEHAGSIASRYIRPSEGTLDFALMYIPSEMVYYRILRSLPDFHSRALRLHVLPVSPTTLFVYVQTIAYGLQGLRIDAAAEAIMRRLSSLSRRLAEVRSSLDVARTHARNLGRNLEEGDAALARMQSELDLPLPDVPKGRRGHS